MDFTRILCQISLRLPEEAVQGQRRRIAPTDVRPQKGVLRYYNETIRFNWTVMGSLVACPSKFMFVVLSDERNREQRMAIRNSWANPRNSSLLMVPFIVNDTSRSQVMQMLFSFYFRRMIRKAFS